MIQRLKRHLRLLDEEIERTELLDLADSRAYAIALKERRCIKKKINRMERIDRKRNSIHKGEKTA